LQELGVARVSVGSGLARAAMGITRRIAEGLKTSGTYDGMLQSAIPYSLSRLFEK
jgi:2-methylisocitrate lyase-like PEP mutase family enzyme